MNLDMNEIEQNLDQFKEEMEKAAEASKPFITVQTYEIIVIILLLIIAACLVLIVARLYKKGAELPRKNKEDETQNSSYMRKQSVSDTLTELKQYLDSGDITMEDYQELKRRVLNGEM